MGPSKWHAPMVLCTLTREKGLEICCAGGSVSSSRGCTVCAVWPSMTALQSSPSTAAISCNLGPNHAQLWIADELRSSRFNNEMLLARLPLQMWMLKKDTTAPS